MFRSLRTYVVTPPRSASCFLGYWLHGLWAAARAYDADAFQAVSRLWSRRLIESAGIEVRTAGMEFVPRDRASVVASNHLSLADTPLVAGWLPGRFRFLSKESVLRAPIMGAALRRGGHIPVARDDARAGLRALERARVLLESGAASVVLFPEGTRGRGELGPFRGGAALLAIDAQAPLVPLALAGTAEIMPRGALLLRPGVAALVAGEPIPVEGWTRDRREALTAVLRDRIALLADKARQLARQ